jgi:SOS-response transcriptional repressor LexA
MNSTYDNGAQSMVEHTGFPNPGTDDFIPSLNLQALLIKHPSSTFFMRLSGNAWEAIGIFDGDVIIIDKALEPKNTDIVVWWEAQEFRVSNYTHLPPKVAPWGVVTSIIHRYRT